MADRPDKRHRKEALDQWKAQQRAAARARLPLPDDQLQALFDMLGDRLPATGCDHSLRLVHAWCTAQCLDFAPVEAWLHENGGYCDCTALVNARQRWRDAIHDVNW